MTLSHAIEETSNIIDNALNALNSAIKTKIQQAQSGAGFEQVEKNTCRIRRG